MSVWIALRIVKLLAVALFAAGAFGAGFANHQRDRMTAAFWFATPAIIATWAAGYAMAKAAGHSLGAPWISLVMFTSLMGFHHSVLACRKAVRRPPFAGLAAGWVTASIVAMTIREPGVWFWALTAGLGFGAGIGAWLMAKRAEATRPSTPAESGPATMVWFTWMGRFEGLSFLTLLALMIVRKTGGPDLDPWRVVGMTHGILFVVYLQALASATRVAGWGRPGLFKGIAAAIVPFGPFVFEAKVLRGSSAVP